MRLPSPVRSRSSRGREDAAVGVHAGGDIGDRTAGLGHLVRPGAAGHRKEAALALDQQVVGLLLLVGTAFAVAGDIADDQSREALAQRLVGQAQARGGARREVLHQHVGAGQQLLQQRQRLGLLEIEAEALLGTIGPDEVRRQAVDPLVVTAGEIADAGAFDLDHPRAEIGQLAGAEGRGDGVLQADHGDAVERARLVGLRHGSDSLPSSVEDEVRLVRLIRSGALRKAPDAGPRPAG